MDKGLFDVKGGGTVNKLKSIRNPVLVACVAALSVGLALPVLPQDQPDELAEARALLEAGKLEEAIGRLEQLAQTASPPQGVARALGVAYYRKQDYMAAISHLRQAVEQQPEDKEAVQLLGLSYFSTGRPEQAIPLLEKVQSWYADPHVDASYVLGLSYIQIKDYERARKAFATMYGVREDSAASYLFLARFLLRQGFDPVAEEYAQKAAKLDPNLPLAHFLLGELHMYKSRIPEAVEEFRKELAINPTHAPTYYKLADAHIRILEFDEAHRLLKRSIWLDATASGPFILMGKVLLKKEQPQLALRALQRALKMDPNNFMAHHLLGQAYLQMGETEKAQREFELSQKLQAAGDSRP